MENYFLNDAVDEKSWIPRRPHVLLAEDEFLIRYDLAEVVRELGWHVYEVATADEGIAIVESGVTLDLVVSDINMPGENDGVALAHMVRRHLPHARVVLMSGMVKAKSLPDGLCDLFLSKPVLDMKSVLSQLMGHVVGTHR